MTLVVVGLLSGGKDSCYNLCHCAKQGHQIAALATLAPPQGQDELDSYMYQTVGHDAVHLIAEAMEVPLYRHTITGQALNQTSSYGNRLASSSSQTLDASDETEDLYRLLQKVKAAQPELNAVSVGAILSNYQRIRVEHVALRAGLELLPLSFLWQRDQKELLDEMCLAGLDSILIKTAGAGLDEGDLGKNLMKMRPKLHKLHDIYGAHICGEGGEYETFTLDCPLFKKRIVLDKTTTVVHSDSSFASVFYLQINAAHLEVKEQTSLQEVTIPAVLDSLSQSLLQQCEEAPDRGDRLVSLQKTNPLLEPEAYRPSIHRRGHWCAFGSIIGLPSLTIRQEFISAFDSLMAELAKQSLSPAHLVHLNVYLSSQNHFAELNQVYRSYFGVDPPSRACVSVNHSTCNVVLDALALDDGMRYNNQEHSSSPPARRRKVLHVQSRSYWAAANIGPYSQSVNAHGRITIAGQIGLLPATLQLASPPILEIVLALQHARRVFKATLEARADKQKGWIEGCICWVDDVRWIEVAYNAWKAQSSNDEQGWASDWLGRGLSIDNIPITFILLPNNALPRSAAAEWQLFAHDGRAVIDSNADLEDEDDEAEDEGEAPMPTVWTEDGGCFASFVAHWKAVYSKKGASTLGIAHLTKSQQEAAITASLLPHLSAALSVKVLYHQQDDLAMLQASVKDLPCATTFVPVCACYDGLLQPCNATLIWQSVE